MHFDLVTKIVITLVFACGGYLAVELARWYCDRLTPLEDGPKPGKPPIAVLVIGAGVIGLGLALRETGPLLMAMALVLCVALVCCWYSDVRLGVLPDVFTLIPLGLVIIVEMILRQYGVLIAVALVSLPFMVLAKATKGRGMGWGDVKLAALGGAILGYNVIGAFAAASFVAAIVSFARGIKTEPIAFGPYLAASIGLAMVLGAR